MQRNAFRAAGVLPQSSKPSARHCPGALVLAALLCAAATGCSTYQQQNKFIARWRRGDLAGADVEATRKAEKAANGKDGIIWRLEEAAILRAIGQYAASNRAFDQAQNRIEQYAQEAKTKLGNEAGALLSNQANLPYRGRAYDGIMLNTYKALNYLQLGEPDKARVELIRAYQRQQDAVEENSKRIAKTQEQVAEQKNSQQIEKAQQDRKFQDQLHTSFGDLDQFKVYADYVNPFTVYLDGLFYMANATGQADLEHARKSFERASSFATENKFLKADMDAMDGVLQGKPIPPSTFIIFETGCAPERDQTRIDIPIFVTRVSYVGAAFPKLKFESDFAPSLNVTGNGLSETTATVCSMDSVIALDFKNELPTIIAKTIASTIAKAAASYAVNAAAGQQSDALGLFAQIATAIYGISVNIADLRTWTTLPKEFQVCRVVTPDDRKLELSTARGAKIPVTVGEGRYNVVYVKSTSSSSPLLVSQMKLK